MKASEYVAALLGARDIVHLAHLSTLSYARHKAFGGLYEDILDYTDNFVETYQGQTGKLIEVKKIDAVPVPDDGMEAWLEEFCDGVVKAAKLEFAQNMDEYGHFVNDIETLIGQIYHTLYKLKFLR